MKSNKSKKHNGKYERIAKFSTSSALGNVNPRSKILVEYYLQGHWGEIIFSAV